ncbi:tungsten ABC transporter substrate-binding protein [Methanofollis aquaemaris]|uniref:Tungsten ABC transporter substrate-binding protein n=1 Tax=Methanofollis aquaemaris TaxID=126734 RepID=A0A8A3S7L5_9EURY|nr:substrate-binding domain-containing protein [Methanofollis aquaemaris]QSZ67674.1 tungsten ABC transporter substrate-binding protein [Methanofollis aquaemaris]
MKKITFIMLVVIMVAAAVICGCTTPGGGEATPTPTPTETTAAPGGTQTLLIATTTSLQDTGLLDNLRPIFEEQYNADVKITAKGTGQSLELGRAGDVDVMMVHDRVREDEFVDEGYGANRRVFAYNYFTIVGPESDPAGIANMTPEEAFTTFREKGLAEPGSIVFVSRGDDSGTHGKEKAIWEAAGFNYTTDIQGSGEWYVEAGTGMGSTLVMTGEKQAYTLSDIGTYLAYKTETGLVPLVDQGDILLNIYSVMEISPEKYPDVNSTLAKEWINFLISPEIQEEIGNFGVEEYGQPLFNPSQGAWEVLGVERAETEEPVT